MKQGEFDQTKDINADLLLDEMQAALGNVFISMDTGVPVKVGFREKLVILVRLTDDATEDVQAKVETVIADHVPTGVSRRQLKALRKQDAKARFYALDFAVIRALPEPDRNEMILNALEDLHALLQGDE